MSIMPTRLRVTEIEDFLTCRWLWDYKWNQGLRIPDADERAGPRLTGRAVHHGIESALLLGGGQAAALRYAAEYLTQYEGSAKYARGVETCIKGVAPALFTLVAPQVELELSWLIRDTDYVLIGRPDLWYIADDGAYIIDHKTTSKDEAERGRGYQTWSQQMPLYGLLVAKYLESIGVVLPIYTQHLILSTQGRHFETIPLLYTRAIREQQEDFVQAIARSVQSCRDDPRLLYPTRDYFPCNNCDFAAVDEVRLTGKDFSSIIDLHYQKREGHR